MRAIRKYVFLTLITFCLLATFQSYASERTIRFCSSDFPGFISLNQSTQQLEGLAYDFAKRLLAKVNLDDEIELLPWARCDQFLKTAVFDATLMITKNPARLEYLEYTAPIIGQNIYLFFKKGHAPAMDDKTLMSRLDQFSFVGGRGFSITEELKSKGYEVSEVTSQEQAYRMVAAGRIDFVTDILSSHKLFINKHPDLAGQFEFIKTPYAEKLYYIGISKQSSFANRVDRLNSAIQELKTSGELQQLIDKDPKGHAIVILDNEVN